MLAGAGTKVELVPATDYTKEWLRRYVKSEFPLREPRDVRLAKFVRRMTADEKGNFEFTGLPAGEYILTCVIHSHSEGLISSDDSPDQRTPGGIAFAVVNVVGNEVGKVVLSN